MSNNVFNEVNEHAKNVHVHQNAVALANVIELVCGCVREAATGALSDALGQDSLTRDVVANIAANRIKEKLIF